MKKTFLLLAACALIATGCDNSTKQDNPVKKDLNKFATNTITVKDSLMFQTEEVEEGIENMLSYSAVVDVPETENEALRNNIITWIRGLLDENYNGDAQDVKAMLEFEKKAFFEEDGMEMTPTSVQHAIKMEENNDRFVTYCDESWFYSGGAYGVTYLEGATFSKETGTRFSSNMFNDQEQMREMIKAAVKTQYFDPLLEGSDLTFEDIYDQESVEAFPLPDVNPWIRNDSVFFIYQDDEIAPHAFGLPGCGIPFENLKDALTDEGKAFFNK